MALIRPTAAIRERAQLRGRGGYTLTEMMLVVAILGVLALVGPPLLINMTNFWRQTGARASVTRDARASLDIIDRMLRQAQASTIVIDQAAGQPSWSRISFTLIDGRAMSFYQSNNVLYVKNGTSVSPLCSDLGFIAFSFPRSDDTSIVSVALTTQAASYLGQSKALQLSIQKVRIMN